MKKTMTKAVTLTATATMLIGTIPFTATSVLAGEKYPAISTYNEIGQTQTNIYDELEAFAPEEQTATQDLEVNTPESPELDTQNTEKVMDSGTWGTCAWEYTSNGELILKGGKGESVGINHNHGYEGSTVGDIPWAIYANNGLIKKITIQDKITFDEGTDLSYLFVNNRNLKEIDGLDKLDTSNVTNMSYMFWGCHSLEKLDLSNFNISNVTDMSDIFDYCDSLETLDLSGFDLSKITNWISIPSSVKEITMPKEFGSDDNLNRILNSLKEGAWTDVTSNKEYEEKPDTLIAGHKYVLTKEAETELKNEGEWGTCKWSINDGVLTINGGVGETTEDKTYPFPYYRSPWEYRDDVTKINITGDITFDTDTSLRDLFRSMSNVVEITGLDKLDTSNVIDMYGMFYECSSLKTLDVSGLNTSNVKIMSCMFSDCSSLESLNLSGFDTSNVTSMSSIFSGCSSLESLDLSDFDTSNVTSMSGIFSGCSSLESLDLSGFDTSNVISMNRIFSGCSNLKSLNLSSFDLSNSSSSASELMYNFPNSIENITMPKNMGADSNIDTIIKNLPNGSWTDKTANKKYEKKPDTLVAGHNYVIDVTSKAEGEWGTCKWSITDGVLTINEGVVDSKSVKTWDEYKNSITKINIVGDVTVGSGTIFEGVSVGSGLERLFSGFRKVTEINGLDKLHTDKITNVNEMFYNCSSLKTLDLSSFDLSEIGVSVWIGNVLHLDIEDMITGCESLEQIIMPKKFVLYYEDNTLSELKKGMSDVSWTDRTDKVKYDGVPDTLIEGHRYVVTGSEYDKDDDNTGKDDTNKGDDNSGKDDTNKGDDNSGKDDTNKGDDNSGKDDTNKGDDSNNGKDDTNKDDDNTSKDDTNKDNNNTSKDDTNKDNNNTSKDDTNKDNNNNSSKDDINKDNNNTSDDTNKDNNNNNDVVAKKNGLLQGEDGNWYYYVDGNIDTNYAGLAENEYGWWKVTNGTVDFGYNGLANNQYGWWKVTNGTVDFSANGLQFDEGTDKWWYFNDGAINFTYTGLAENEYGWWKITDGNVDFAYNGLGLNEYGWWKVTNGAVDLSFNGVADNEYGWWKVTNGTVDFAANGLQFDKGTNAWWYFKDGLIDRNYTGLAENEFGWWKITDGTVDFNFNGMAENEYGWWKVANGAVDLSFTGLAENEYGWWYLTNGTVDFGYNGVAENQYGWWKITNGAVDLTANGLIFDAEKNAWFYFNNGAIDFEYNQLAENENGWWKVINGTVDFTYNGQANNQYGTWNVVNGHVEV